ncbi:MAG: ATP-binding protein [Candidatus Marinimicrobia bacterium]|nr:ATP-binding protein [Candidatus Neomarinimicrobiota bacterium]
MTDKLKIRPRVRDTIFQSLRAGVVPRSGQKHIQVGRGPEVKALLNDVERIADGGSGIRFIIGEFGSGKTFFLNLIRSIALEKKLVTVHADLNPDRRLHATNGQARSLYRELMRNLSTRSKPDGEALPSVIERFVTSALQESRADGLSPEIVIRKRLQVLSEMVGGYDFAEVISAYWRGYDTGDEELKSSAIRWLRGEFSTKTDARIALGVRTIIDDSNVYDHIKLFARFVKLSGYSGLMVCLDELVNLYKLANTRARNSNYEQILRILNDSLQGTANGLGFLLGGTPEFLMDTRKGLYSYQALQSRLTENTFAREGLVDLTGPVIRLSNLSPEDIYVLLGKLRHVYAFGDPSGYLLPDDGLKAFMEHCSKKIGDAYFRTPRNTVTAFVDLMAVLEQNEQVAWNDLISGISVKTESNPDFSPLSDNGESGSLDDMEDDELTSFKL